MDAHNDMAECVMCGRPVDTREEAEGGDALGAQLSTGEWACSAKCWYAAVEEKENRNADDT